MPLIALDHVSIAFGHLPLLDDVSLQIDHRERVAIIGRNGTGKSTLLQIISGEVPPDSGTVWTQPALNIARLVQDVPLTATRPVFDVVAEGLHGLAGHDAEEWRRQHKVDLILSRLDLDGEVIVDTLSGGWRRRVLLARALVAEPDLLLLDEPTNHLDIAARETLEELLKQFDGTVLFVSHDRFFTDRIATKIWAVGDGQLTEYLGNYTDYQRALGRRQEPPPVKAPEPVKVEAPKPFERRPHQSVGRIQKNLTGVERDISRLEGKLNELSDALAIASIEADVDALSRLGAEFERVQTDLDAAYARWEELSADLEAVAQ
jgi:ATP-binding cassette subfamily F protein uup